MLDEKEKAMPNKCELFNDGWLFAKEKIDTVAEICGSTAKTLDWKPVYIPHDWLICDTGNLYGSSVGFYKKEFNIKKGGKLFCIRFDGVYMESSVYVNAIHAGDWKYGYSAFEFDITSFLRDGSNEIIVKVVYESPNSRWYTGAGIYRNVWFLTRNKTHISSNGVYITPSKIPDSNTWEVAVESEINIDRENTVENPCIEVRHTIFDPAGNIAAGCGHALSVADTFVRECQVLKVSGPSLWRINDTNIYRLVTEIYQEKIIVHTEENSFGFRTAEFDPDKGFLLNGERIKLQGVCQHHDLGALGAAMNVAALKRQLNLLKEMGANAVRTAHNMPDPALMDLADEMGLLIVSEAFDMWEMPKTAKDYARFFTEWAEKDVASWVRRDRNHPSLIMWSIGNEVYDTHADAQRGAELIKMLVSFVRNHDPKGHAPVTIGSNYLPWENTQKCADAVKLVGYNYADYLYNDHHKKYPDWIIYGSETCSVVQSRGIYHFPSSQSVLADDDEQCSSLGNSATSWGARSTEACIISDRDAPFSAGQFIWTGTDYIGEPTPYHTKNSYFGQIDTAGFKKDSFYIFQSAWTDCKTNPVIHIFPYWDFSEGQTIDIRAVSNAPKIELFFTDDKGRKSLGTFDIDHKKGRKLIGDWQLPYKKGTLLAVAYDENGRVIAEAEKSSFGDAVKIVFLTDKQSLLANGEDVVFVEISAADENGTFVENANNRINLTVEGAGYLIGIDNGDSTDYDQYKGTSKRLFSGKLLAIIAATMEVGEIKITAESPGLPAATLAMRSVAADIRKGVSVVFTPNKKSPANEEIPIRKICLTSGRGNSLNEISVKADVYPKNATYGDLEWRVTDKAGIDSSIASLSVDGNTAKIKAVGDGEIFVRCGTANSGTKNGNGKVNLYSQLDFNFTGLGKAYLNPYGFISGGLYNRSNTELANGNERGVATLRDGVSHVGFEGIDFGSAGADEITISIFSLSKDPFPVEIWEGMPDDDGSRKLAVFTYTSGSAWNTYIEETYKLPVMLKGITSICFVLRQKIHIKGFKFKKIKKAYEQINARDYSFICGDSYEVTNEAVERIGNNVTVEFDDMDFSEDGVTKLFVCGRTPLNTNSIQIKFDDSNDVQMVSFSKSACFEVQEFDLKNVNSRQKVSFIFLPGCNFDLKWFRFE